jgi:FAD/FMN-containing dehydrogenase
MDGVRIDPEQRTATFDAGVLWKPVMEAASAHGLLPIAGSLSAVGAAGYLLGGGTSPLARSHGYSSDYVESMTVVTGAGEIVTASSSSNPELFWALRGGKSGLGIVTGITLRLVELQQVYGGALTFSEDQMDEAFRGWIDWTRTADERVTTSFATISFPDMDGMPPPFRGKRISFLRFAYPGDPERGAELAVPLRALAPALHDDIGPLPTDQLDRIHNDPTTPVSAWEVGGQLRVLDDASPMSGWRISEPGSNRRCRFSSSGMAAPRNIRRPPAAMPWPIAPPTSP